MYVKTIYLSGGSFFELEALYSHINGVEKVVAGYINAADKVLSYDDVLNGRVDAVFGVELKYNPKIIDLSSLLDIHFTVVNPYVEDQSEDLKGSMYRAGVWYNLGEDAVIIDYYMNFIHNRQKTPAATEAGLTMNDPNSQKVNLRRCFAQAGKLLDFCPAEEEYQQYLLKNPDTKTHIDFKMLKELNIMR